MIRGSTYPIDIISKSPVGWEPKWFDSGTGVLEVRQQGKVINTFDLDIFKISSMPGFYRVYATMPEDVEAGVTIQATGTVDSFLMRTNHVIISLKRG